MTDTTQEIANKQIEIFLSKTPKERITIGMNMLEMGRIIVESSIKNKYPNLSELDLKIKVFERYYDTIFEDKELQKIIYSMKEYYKLNE